MLYLIVIKKINKSHRQFFQILHNQDFFMGKEPWFCIYSII